MRKLAVAETPADIEPVFVQTYTNGWPGFQIGSDVSTAESLAILQEHMRTKLGLARFTFNASFGTVLPEGMPGIIAPYVREDDENEHDSGPHVDESQARRKLGIVLHENIRGVGRVVLQLAKYGVTELDSDAQGRSVVHRRNVASPPFEGTLEPGRKTMFFEGFRSLGDLSIVTVGPTIHDFQSTGGRREWLRYSWEPIVP
jgi:hypothetical protein